MSHAAAKIDYHQPIYHFYKPEEKSYVLYVAY